MGLSPSSRTAGEPCGIGNISWKTIDVKPADWPTNPGVDVVKIKELVGDASVTMTDAPHARIGRREESGAE